MIMAKIACLVDDLFEQVEMTEPKRLLEAKGHQVVLIGASKSTVQGLHHDKKGSTFNVDMLLKDIHAYDFDALMLPGGTLNADSLRVNEQAQALVQAFYAMHKPIAAICHAPWVLISSHVVRGRTLTAYHTLKDDLQNAGADYVDQQVCIDNTLITSRCPDDIPAFADAINEALNGTNHIHQQPHRFESYGSHTS